MQLLARQIEVLEGVSVAVALDIYVLPGMTWDQIIWTPAKLIFLLI